MFPDKLMIGMEIRVKVSDYVIDRITALREKHPGKYQNIACIRTNAMKYLPNFFRKAQVLKFVSVNLHTMLVFARGVQLLRSLHWLLVGFGVLFRIGLLTCRTLRGEHHTFKKHLKTHLFDLAFPHRHQHSHWPVDVTGLFLRFYC